MANLEQLQNEIAPALEEALNGSKLDDLLENYGLKDVVRVQLEVDINKMKTSQNSKLNTQVKSALESMSTGTFIIMDGCPGRKQGPCTWCAPCGACPSCF
ncbi:MAG: hypothetical protein SWZ49_28680 [Cyanobacteriota bacterium]|nr:hypothetical protein [Cyanobacteriota bacterium]